MNYAVLLAKEKEDKIVKQVSDTVDKLPKEKLSFIDNYHLCNYLRKAGKDNEAEILYKNIYLYKVAKFSSRNDLIQVSALLQLGAHYSP